MATAPSQDKTDPKKLPPARNTAGLTPAMRQYVDQKKQVGDAILFFRMGDFYEMFYEDAELASGILGIALTSRSKGTDGDPIPLAGIPYHALDGYLTKLVRAGYRVAIAEQVEDAKQAKGVVKREVVRVVTPGTLVDDALLDEHTENVLAAICGDSGQAGLAIVELASGRFEVFDLQGDALLDELAKLRPAELLINEEAATESLLGKIGAELKTATGCSVTRRSKFDFLEHNAETTLKDRFQVATLEGFGFAGMNASLRAAGALIAYLNETQKTALSHIIRITRRTCDRTVNIDHNSWQSLEIDRTIRGGRREGSLLAAVDRTVHALGSRQLQRWICAPLQEPSAITERQDVVSYFLERDSTRQQVRSLLKGMADVERITARIALARTTPRDLAYLAMTLNALPALQDQLGEMPPALLEDLASRLGGLEDAALLLTEAIRPDAPLTIREGGIVQPGFDAELDRLNSISQDGQSWLANYQQQMIGETGINTLKVGFNRVFGYYIEVSHANAGRVPANFVRKQTIKNAERFITDELKKFETEVLTADEKARELEASLFENIRQQVAKRIDDLMRTASAIGQIDALAGLAELAIRQRYIRPTLSEVPHLDIQGGRHPVLEQMLKGGFVPNDCVLTSQDARLFVITGPNMAGKSTYIRQVALITLLAQIGSFVPAEAMDFAPVDRIFTRVGASDEISRGQSTFMVEMTEAANILNNATEHSLVILDELGRGTSTFDGLSLAWAITEHLTNNIRCLTLMATHYHELTELAELLQGVQNHNVAVREISDANGQDSIAFLHRILPGGTDKSYGLHVARLAGVPNTVIVRSREVLAELERSFERETKRPELSRQSTRKSQQMMLFTDPAEKVAEELRKINLEQLTPLEAIAKLGELQEKLNG